jgi:hypothetical protein
LHELTAMVAEPYDHGPAAGVALAIDCREAVPPIVDGVLPSETARVVNGITRCEARPAGRRKPPSSGASGVRGVE